MLIARTDWDVPKAQGNQFLHLPDAPTGVEVRPIHQITGESEFNEVFITEARVPDANLVGEAGGGWAVLQLALAYERRLMGDLAPDRACQQGPQAGRRQPDHDGPVGWKLTDSYLRQEIARAEAYSAVNRWNTQRAKATRDRVEAATLLALGKIAMSRILHTTARVQTEIVGPGRCSPDRRIPSATL